MTDMSDVRTLTHVQDIRESILATEPVEIGMREAGLRERNIADRFALNVSDDSWLLNKEVQKSGCLDQLNGSGGQLLELREIDARGGQTVGRPIDQFQRERTTCPLKES